MLDETGLESGPDPRQAGLVYVSPGEPGIERRRAGKGFAYRDADRRPIADPDEIRRIRALAVPPAWRDVWICPRPNGHIQAIGYDDRGRRQYRYHASFRQLREHAKFDHTLTFAKALPTLRARVDADKRKRGLGRDKVIATIVHLLEATMIRVGNGAYARANKSYGLTTLRGRHVAVDGGELRFNFKGKSGKLWRLSVRDRRIARIVRDCQDLPGQLLFQYLDEEGQARSITSSDVNAYLKRVTGQDITAKDFRTWAATVLAAQALASSTPPENPAQAKKTLRDVIQQVAARLGNTPTICRKCYIHPAIQDAYLAGALIRDCVRSRASSDAGLPPGEGAVFAFLSGASGVASKTSSARPSSRQ
jgi:DNA topoisomerase-1